MAKRKHEEEHENHERWLVSYADFITLLFAFFTVLYATSQHDISKAQEFQKSIQKAFRSFIDFGGLIGKYVSHDTATQLIPPPIDVVPQEGPGPQETEDTIKRALVEEFGDETDEDHGVEDVYSDSVGIRVTLASEDFFDSGSALIKESALPTLQKLAKAFSKVKNRLIVEGFTDNVDIHTSKYPSNWELSAARASTIVRYFITQYDIPATRLTAVGYADQKPLVSNDTPAHRAKNRRIEILIVTDDHRTAI